MTPPDSRDPPADDPEHTIRSDRDRTSSTDSPRILASAHPPVSVGNYTIIGKLGEGGMGVVYEAEQRTPKRRVALKVVRGGRLVDESSVKMFQREAETLGRLDHLDECATLLRLTGERPRSSRPAQERSVRSRSAEALAEGRNCLDEPVTLAGSP
jgi:serine/threonine protein kinase